MPFLLTTLVVKEPSAIFEAKVSSPVLACPESEFNAGLSDFAS